MKFTPFSWAKDLYGSIMDLIGFVVEQTSDKSADLASRALPIIAPLPNAITIYTVTQATFNFTEWQALAFAASVEVALFAMIDTSLRLFDSLDEHREKYEKPFKILSISTAAIMVIIMVIVFVIESQSEEKVWVMSLLPLISGLCAVGLALSRWDNRNKRRWAEAEAEKRKQMEADAEAKRKQMEVEAEIKRVQIEADAEAKRKQIEADAEERKRLQRIEDEERAAKLQVENKRLEVELEIAREAAKAKLERLANRSVNRSVNRSPERFATEKDGLNDELNGELNDQLNGSTERRKALLRAYRESPGMSIRDAADMFNVSRGTVSNDIAWLLGNGMIHVKKIGKGQTVTLNGGSEEFLAG